MLLLTMCVCGSGYEEVLSLQAEAQAEGTAFFSFLPTGQGTERPRARRSLGDPFSRWFLLLGRSCFPPSASSFRMSVFVFYFLTGLFNLLQIHFLALGLFRDRADQQVEPVTWIILYF